MNNINLLILGGGKRVSFIKYLKNETEKQNIKLNVYSYELSKKVPISSYAEVLIGKKWNDTGIIKHISSIIEKHKINIILPFVDPATIISAKLKIKFPEIFIPVSNEETMNIFFNKLLSSNWFNENSISHPKKEKHVPPIIAKPIYGSSSKGILIMKNKDDIRSNQSILNSNEFICEQFISGKEYTVDAYISDKNEILYCVPRLRIETSGGESIHTRTSKHTKIINSVKEITKKINFLGPITLQLIEEDNSGIIYFIEVNPRLAGAVICSIGAGVNIPLILINGLKGLQTSPANDWKDNFTMVRYFSEVFFNADNY